ncbi:amidase family protein [Streptomyces sp. NPDC050560]|uniref:amidase family protein n=1 Tax=Streptomyces sp. NPDC050560 TaxID=3365630 RepID=UPI00378F18E9
MSNRPWGHLRAPEPDQINTYAKGLGWRLTAEETALYTRAVGATLAGLDEIEELPEHPVPLRHPYRDPGHTPQPGEDPYNAVIRFCEVRGAAEGPLAGRTLGVKDCIAVAGVPMTNGGRREPVVVPTEDAVVIERLLDAGVTVTAKTNLEDLGFGLGEGSAFGPARNPADPARSTGGSSSGSGAAVASGLVDLALGADEGGSVRIPAAWCGLVGMKATHGLVPSYGMSYMNHTLDHIGPITRTVADNALMLEVMAGPDWRDPQWTRDLPEGPDAYTSAAERGVEGLRVGVLTEAVGPVGTTEDVRTAFEAAVKTLAGLGASVSEVSVPLWEKGWAISMATMPAGTSFMVKSNGTGGFAHMGRVDPRLVAALAAQSRTGGDDLPPMLKSMMFAAEHVYAQYGGVPFVKGHNLRLDLRRQVAAALSQVDVLVMPTIPTVAHELLTGRSGLDAFLVGEGRVGRAVANTSPTDLTGHPSLTVPCGTGEANLPVGLQIVGPRYAEKLLYQVGYAFEAV